MITNTDPRKVLVLCDQPMAAALLGMLLELEGYEPAFPQESEAPDAALERVKPLLVVLVDHVLDVARSDIFLMRAARRQVGVAVFAAEETKEWPPHWAVARRVPSFRMPVDGAELRRAIDESTSSYRLWRTGADRRKPRLEGGVDGVIVYHDRRGQRWHVYDRRGSDRRQNAEHAPRAGHRAFVNDAGEEWRVAMTAADFLEASPHALESQLSRAVRSSG